MSALRVFGGLSVEPSKPVLTIVTHLAINGGQATAIARKWADERAPTCGGLCDTEDCKFADGMCQVVIPSFVPSEACPTFRRA